MNAYSQQGITSTYLWTIRWTSLQKIDWTFWRNTSSECLAASADVWSGAVRPQYRFFNASIILSASSSFGKLCGKVFDTHKWVKRVFLDYCEELTINPASFVGISREGASRTRIVGIIGGGIGIGADAHATAIVGVSTGGGDDWFGNATICDGVNTSTAGEDNSAMVGGGESVTVSASPSHSSGLPGTSDEWLSNSDPDIVLRRCRTFCVIAILCVSLYLNRLVCESVRLSVPKCQRMWS